jgi:hypothetical protein
LVTLGLRRFVRVSTDMAASPADDGNVGGTLRQGLLWVVSVLGPLTTQTGPRWLRRL